MEPPPLSLEDDTHLFHIDPNLQMTVPSHSPQVTSTEHQPSQYSQLDDQTQGEQQAVAQREEVQQQQVEQQQAVHNHEIQQHQEAQQQEQPESQSAAGNHEEFQSQEVQYHEPTFHQPQQPQQQSNEGQLQDANLQVGSMGDMAANRVGSEEADYEEDEEGDDMIYSNTNMINTFHLPQPEWTAPTNLMDDSTAVLWSAAHGMRVNSLPVVDNLVSYAGLVQYGQ